MFEHPTHPTDQRAFAGFSAIVGFGLTRLTGIEPLQPSTAIASALLMVVGGTPMIAVFLGLWDRAASRVGRALRLYCGSGLPGAAAGMIAAVLSGSGQSMETAWTMIPPYAAIGAAGFLGVRMIEESSRS